MSERRVFRPLTPTGVAEAVRADEVPAGGPVFLAEAGPEGAADAEEQAEFDALCAAAAASVALLVDSAEPARRAVVVIRVPDTLVRTGEESVLLGPVPWSAVDAVYLDEAEAEADLDAVLIAVRRGTEPTDAQYDAIEERALLWFAPDEVAG